MKTEDLLTDIKALKEPNYHDMDSHQRLFHAVLCAYLKHQLGSDDIGWQELGDILHSVICNEIGETQFCDWVDKIV